MLNQNVRFCRLLTRSLKQLSTILFNTNVIGMSSLFDLVRVGTEILYNKTKISISSNCVKKNTTTIIKLSSHNLLFIITNEIMTPKTDTLLE